MNPHDTDGQSENLCAVSPKIMITDVKENYSTQAYSGAEKVNNTCTIASLSSPGVNTANILNHALNDGSTPFTSIATKNLKVKGEAEQVVMYNPQKSVVIDSQGAEISPSVDSMKIAFESNSSSDHQNPAFPTDAVNSNYFVLVESSDGSQVISGVIPNLLSSTDEQSQLALNAVLPSEISYIGDSSLDQGKGQADYPTHSVTMVLDPSLQSQESQKIFLEPASLISIDSQTISQEQLTVMEKGSEQSLQVNAPHENIIIHSNESSLPHGLRNVQLSAPIEDSSSAQPQIQIFPLSSQNWSSKKHENSERSLASVLNQGYKSTSLNENEKTSVDEQRLRSLRLLEQSHLQHQDELLNRRKRKWDEMDKTSTNQSSEKLLKEAGIDDSTPVFSCISAKFNPELLVHVPGCQQFLLTEAARNTPSSEVTFSSEFDCSFNGNIRNFVSLYTQMKTLLKLPSPTNLHFEKSGSKTDGKESKGISCNLLVPYVSSKGRTSRQSAKLMQMDRLLVECLSGEENGSDKIEVRKQKRGYRRRQFLRTNNYKKQQKHTVPAPSGKEITEPSVGDETSPEEYSVPLQDTPEPTVLSHIKDENKLLEEPDNFSSAFDERLEVNDSCVNPQMPDVTDPVQRRLLEEQIKCKQIYEDNNKLKRLKAMMVTQQKQFTESTESAARSEPEGQSKAHGPENPRRSNKGRPPKKFDPSEAVGRVRPRNPLTESAETKQHRVYEENVAYKFFCDQCSFKSKRQSQFNHHLSCHAKGTDKKYHCRHCDFISISLSALKQHELVHKQNVLKCEICNVYVTDKKSLMQKHIRLKHSPKAMMAPNKRFPCLECPATFTSKTALNKHQATHLNPIEGKTLDAANASHVCPQCKKSFGKKIHLHRHVRDVHGPQQRPHLCDKCGRGFKRKDALQQHRIVHVAKSARVLPFRCTKCDKAFRSQAHLKEHASIHSTERPFLCQYCGSSFKTQPVQKKHILTLHVQPRTHVCGVCCRQFNTKNALQRHENTHKPPSDQMVVDEGISQWEAEVADAGVMKIEMKDNSAEVSSNVMVSLEEDPAATALVVEAEGGTQVMVNPGLVPAIMAPSDGHSSAGARSLDVQQALIQGSQAEQAFYYLTDDQLQTIQ